MQAAPDLAQVLADGGVVYYLADPRTPRRPRYVGSAKDAAARAYQHAKPSAGRGELRAWKESLRAAGLAPQLVVLATYPTRQAAYEVEWRLIQRWRRRGLCDLNSTVEGRRQRWDLSCAGRRRRRTHA